MEWIRSGPRCPSDCRFPPTVGRSEVRHGRVEGNEGVSSYMFLHVPSPSIHA